MIRSLVTAATALALVSAGALAATSAQAATDVTAPQLVDVITSAPATVDVTNGSADVTFTAHLTDDLSGVDSATLTLTTPAGWAADVTLTRVGGTALDGTWTGTETVNSFDPAGTWTATWLSVTDLAGNGLDKQTGLGSGVVVTRTVDSTPPVLLDATLGATAADATAGPADVPLTVRARDTGSGVAGGEFTFTSPDGQDTVSAYLDDGPDEGTPNDGTWHTSVVFPARSAPGIWRLTHASLVDGQFSSVDYDDDDDALPLLAVRVRSDADTAAPVLTSFGVGPARISTAYLRSGWLYAQVGFTDDVSGLADATVTLQRPDGTLEDAEPGSVLFDTASARTGTSRAGTVTVPIHTTLVATGTWKVASVRLIDRAGNVTTVANADLGTRASVEVSSAAADTLAPNATGYAFAPTTVDTRNGPAGGSVLIAGVDPDAVPSGIASGTATLTSPSGLQTTSAAFTTDSADGLADGDPASGTFRAGFSLPEKAEDGQWRITTVSLTDAAGHAHAYAAADLGTAPALTVLGSGRPAPTPPGAPAAPRATLSGTTAALAWTAPASNGGAALAGYLVSVYDGAALVRSLDSTTTSVTVTGLARGHTYTFTVAAENRAGVGAESAASNAVTVAPGAPGAPTGVRADLTAPGDTSVALSWTPPASDGGSPVSDYRVTPYLGTLPQPAQFVDGPQTSFTVSGLDRGRTYTFRVAAVNAVGTSSPSGASNPVSVAATVPAAPRAVTATSAGATATVRWTAPDDGGSAITGYQVTGAPGGSCRTAGTSCVVTGLTAATSYSFTVTATNGVGAGTESPASNPVTATAAVPTTFTIGSVPSRVAYGATVTVSGTLTRSDDHSPAGGELVRLQYRRPGTTTWTTAPGSARSNAAGAATLRLRPSRTVEVRLVSAGSAAYRTAASAARTVQVRRWLSLTSSHGTIARGRSVVLAGRATPAAGRAVLLQRWTSHGWRTVVSRMVRGSGYSFAVRTWHRGSYAYRVAVQGDGSYATSTSGTRRVQVR